MMLQMPSFLLSKEKKIVSSTNWRWDFNSICPYTKALYQVIWLCSFYQSTQSINYQHKKETWSGSPCIKFIESRKSPLGLPLTIYQKIHKTQATFDPHSPSLLKPFSSTQNPRSYSTWSYILSVFSKLILKIKIASLFLMMLHGLR